MFVWEIFIINVRNRRSCIFTLGWADLVTVQSKEGVGDDIASTLSLNVTDGSYV
jgi:hypothetical protein